MPRVENIDPTFGGEAADPKPYPLYKSHKIIQAFKIAEVVPHPEWDKQSVLVPENTELKVINVTDEYMAKHNPQVGGYYVRYEDGYESWSPAKAFEEGYTSVDKVMGAGDLLNLMDSFTNAERLHVIEAITERYCVSCGCNNAEHRAKHGKPCQCGNEE